MNSESQIEMSSKSKVGNDPSSDSEMNWNTESFVQILFLADHFVGTYTFLFEICVPTITSSENFFFREI